MQKSNFLIANILNKTFDLYIDDYTEEKLKDYRNRYQETHAFFRYSIKGQEKIIIFPLTDDSVVTPEKYTVNPIKDTILVKKFVHELVFREIYQIGRKIEKYTTITFISEKNEDDLISQVVPPEYRTIFGYKKGIKIDSRVFYPDKDSALIGVIINSFYRWDNKLNCKFLHDKGIELKNRFVCEFSDPTISILSKSRVLLGVIIDIDGDEAVIEKSGHISKKLLSDIYVENNFKNRNEIMRELLGDRKFEEIIKIIKNSSGLRKSADSQFSSANRIAEWLIKTNFNSKSGFSFRFTNIFSSVNSQWKLINAQNPTYIFSLREDKIDTYADRGLKKYGPYDSITYTPKTPNIAVICKKTDRGIVTEFLKKFEQGLPSIKSGHFEPYGQGFVRKFKLSSINWSVYEFNSDCKDDYEKAIRSCLQNTIKWDLAIIQTSEKHKLLPASESPYYLAKAKFMANDIPVQGINIETMKKRDEQIVYILNNISLACYAKMGGTPWVIPSNKSIDRELVIGLGNAIIKKDRFKYEKRIVGITTVFNSDGRYMLSSKSAEVDFKDYFEALLYNLRSVFNDIKKNEGWRSGDNVRLVFHCFKPFKNSEANAIKKLMSELSRDLNIIYAFLHIAKEPPLFLIDDEQAGIPSYNGSLKGKWMLKKGTGVKFDDNECLIQLTDAKDIKMASHGMAKPIMLKLHRESTFLDLDYLSQQVFNFAAMSYRSFSSAPLPVTIWYSQMIAKILGNMRDIKGWDSDFLLNKLKYNRWFL